MPDKRNQTLQSLPVANYSRAIARAVEWLGDRYLLAKPINAARTDHGHEQPHHGARYHGSFDVRRGEAKS
jgi:hypothetical protein